MKKFTFQVEKQVQSSFEWFCYAENMDEAIREWEKEMLNEQQDLNLEENVEYFATYIYDSAEEEVKED